MDTPSDPSSTRPVLRRSKSDRVIAGVAGGIGQYLGIDPVLIRIAFVVLLFSGSGFFIYVIAWIVMPEEAGGDVVTRTEGAGGGDAVRLFLGGFLIAVGGFILLDRALPWDWFGRIAGPAALIAIGAGILVYGARR